MNVILHGYETWFVGKEVKFQIEIVKKNANLKCVKNDKVGYKSCVSREEGKDIGTYLKIWCLAQLAVEETVKGEIRSD